MVNGRRRRWVAVLAVLAGVVVLTGAGAWLLLRDPSTPASLEDALARFRAAPPSAQTRPPPGVYAMRTSGEETVDVLGGLRHEYPPLSPLTVTAEDCGTRWRWQPLEQRWDSWLTCPTPDGGQRLVSRTAYHEFVGRGDERTYRCDDEAVAVPARLEPGVEFAATCRSEGTELSGAVELAMQGRVVAVEPVTVDGEPVMATHLRIEETLSGETTGSATVDRWVAAADGRLLRERFEASSTSASFLGEIVRQERFELKLDHADPYR